MTLGCYLPKAQGDGLVPYALLMEAPEFLLGLKLRDVAGRLGLPARAGLVVDGVLDDIFAATPAGQVPSEVDAAIATLSEGVPEIVRSDRSYGPFALEAGETEALNRALRDFCGDGGPVFVRNDETYGLHWSGAMLNLLGKYESLREEFTQAERLCHVPIEEYLGGQALLRYHDGKVKSADLKNISEVADLFGR